MFEFVREYIRKSDESARLHQAQKDCEKKSHEKHLAKLCHVLDLFCRDLLSIPLIPSAKGTCPPTRQAFSLGAQGSVLDVFPQIGGGIYRITFSIDGRACHVDQLDLSSGYCYSARFADGRVKGFNPEATPERQAILEEVLRKLLVDY